MWKPYFNLWDKVEDQVMDIAADAMFQGEGAPFVVYVILDLTRPDPLGQLAGTPLYVGQTAKAGTRAFDHFRNALIDGASPGSIKEELLRLAKTGVLPVIEILQRCDTRRQSLHFENCWAQWFLRQGYHLFNRLAHQNSVRAGIYPDSEVLGCVHEPVSTDLFVH